MRYFHLSVVIEDVPEVQFSFTVDLYRPGSDASNRHTNCLEIRTLISLWAATVFKSWIGQEFGNSLLMGYLATLSPSLTDGHQLISSFSATSQVDMCSNIFC
jgi:hypothetical protein